MTAVTKYASSRWDSSLPAAPKEPFQVTGFTPVHRWDATVLPQGATITEITDEVGAVPLTTTGLTLGAAGLLSYAQLTAQASLLASGLPSADSRTFLAIARAMPGDTGAGPWAMLRVGGSLTYNISQQDADVAGQITGTTAAATDTPLPAARGAWHVYAFVIRDGSASHTAAVDAATQTFTGSARAMTTYALGISGSTRRRLQFAYGVTFAEAMSDAQLISANNALRAHFPELFG
ncbi:MULTISPECIES: hypothetical protein [unclassified Microbacterium]|uniref:hypothetical protein n=1 Tax=Microbacterium TaxID=33882 RepID=UPI003B9E3407